MRRRSVGGTTRPGGCAAGRAPRRLALGSGCCCAPAGRDGCCCARRPRRLLAAAAAALAGGGAARAGAVAAATADRPAAAARASAHHRLAARAWPEPRPARPGQPVPPRARAGVARRGSLHLRLFARRRRILAADALQSPVRARRPPRAARRARTPAPRPPARRNSTGGSATAEADAEERVSVNAGADVAAVDAAAVTCSGISSGSES